MNEVQATENTNGSTPTPIVAAPSPLVAIRAEFEATAKKDADGQPIVDMKAAAKARDEYLKTNQAVEAAEKALNDAIAKNQANARVLMVLTGATPLKFGGVLYNPTSSKNRNVFYRPAGSKDVLEIK